MRKEHPLQTLADIKQVSIEQIEKELDLWIFYDMTLDDYVIDTLYNACKNGKILEWLS